jgi:uncharacterized protein YcfJ
LNMRNTPKKSFAKSLALPVLLTVGVLGGVSAQAQEILARVITSTAVIQQVAVPRQVCNTAVVVSEAPKSGAGAAIGAIAGGAMGNAVGNGSGRALATMIGLVGGAVVGNNVEGSKNQTQNVQQCSTQTSYENRTMHYDVVYEYADKRYSIQMLNDPGQYVRLSVTPVGVLPPPNRTPMQPQSSYQQYQQPTQQTGITMGEPRQNRY